MGRKRIHEDEKKVTLSVNFKKKVIVEMSKDGEPKKIVENIINEKYLKE